MHSAYQASSVTNKNMEVQKDFGLAKCSVGNHLFVPSAFSFCLTFAVDNK